MNQRIQELAEQAGYTPLPGFDFANDLQEVFLKKFAQLIVQECISICKEKERPNLYGFREVENTIKQHFGIE